MEKQSPKVGSQNNCENCGIKDDLEFFEHVFSGITLCQDCALLPISRVDKRGDKIKWVKVNGEYLPPDYPAVKKVCE